MCGFFGLHSHEFDKNDKIIASKKSIKIQNHRGPDFNDFWLSENNEIILSHNRLSILDLSETGNQPMFSRSGNLVIVFNGEIYNHLSIRRNLENQFNFKNWKGSSDTETLLQAVEFWGLEKTLNEISGMFAFAIWDKKKKKLYLARDRFGEKPLYYGWINEIKSFVFGSDLIFDKLFKNINFEINEKALNDLIYLNYINNEYSIFKNIKKIEPGCFANIIFEKNLIPKINIEKFWSKEKIISNKKKNYSKLSNNTKDLDKILTNVVSNQIIADVEVGTFLSGGIDSSLITAKAQEVSSKKVKTFSIGNENKDFDESKYAKEVAKYLKTDHEELILNDREIINEIPNILINLNEPFGDSSFIPTFLVSKMARKKVKVVLTGDGGDEIFGGYNRYVKLKTISNFYKIPKIFKKIISKSLSSLNDKKVKYINKLVRLIPSFKNEYYLDEKIRKILNRIDVEQTYNEYLLGFLINRIDENILYNTKAQSKKTILENLNIKLINENINEYSLEEKMMYLDSANYLPNDVLFKVDRASMANSLETRAPFLDDKLYEFSVNLNIDHKIKKGKGKIVLRELLKKKIPTHLIDRPKAGFSIPINQWINKPLLDWSENLLSKKNIEKSGLLNFQSIKKLWEYQKNGYDNSSLIWSILVFQEWLMNRN